MAHGLGAVATPVRCHAGSAKAQATLSDTIAWMRQQRWAGADVSTSSEEADLTKILRALIERLTETVCLAA